jgi:formylglycine-generating enzyme required for sulfatase activity
MYSIISDACFGKSFYADGGWLTKRSLLRPVKLVRPNGGEVFIAGSDEVLVWEGVMPGDTVKLEYTADGVHWKTISDSASELSYRWRVPHTPSNVCLARVSAQTRWTFFGDMALIPPGRFKMGDITGAGYSEEKPVHEVIITQPFLIKRTEITQAQWFAVMGSNPSAFKGDSLPVEMVSWYAAVDFCNRLSKLEALGPCYSGSGANISCDYTASGYRLPTEAEWEYACRSGSETDFYTGNMSSNACSIPDPSLHRAGWYCGNNNHSTMNAGMKEPNAFGLYDMHGNVWEWCGDWHSQTFYTTKTATDPKGPASGSERVLRGGSWYSYADGCRSAARSFSEPSYTYSGIGFRVVRIFR